MAKNAKQRFLNKKMMEKGMDVDEDEMTDEECIAEHERLVKVLRSGSREELLAEAKIQEDELAQLKAEVED